LPLKVAARFIEAVFWNPICMTMFGYFAAKVALLSGPHDAVVTEPFWPISVSL
jgi:hypothetical protein